MQKSIFLLKNSKFSTFFGFQNFQNHFSPRKKYIFRSIFFFWIRWCGDFQALCSESSGSHCVAGHPQFYKKVCSYELLFGRPFIWQAFQKKVRNCQFLHKYGGAARNSDSQTTLSIKPWSPHITWARKKNWSKNIFFSWRKMILKILLENLDFSIEKIDFSIEKIEIFVFSPKINILFSIFFRNRNFQNHFSPRKKKVFRSIFFSCLRWCPYFKALCSEWSGSHFLETDLAFYKKVHSYDLFFGKPFI